MICIDARKSPLSFGEVYTVEDEYVCNCGRKSYLISGYKPFNRLHRRIVLIRCKKCLNNRPLFTTNYFRGDRFIPYNPDLAKGEFEMDELETVHG